jgi:UDP-N-acetylmuramoyl-L-alanyl-D-glutamate--2,6-diaminopimelate ligase
VTVHEADGPPVPGVEYSETHGHKMGIFAANTRLVGRHNVYNLLAALIGSHALLESEHTAGFLANILTEYGSAPGRLEAVGVDDETMKNVPFRVFVDYAHTHDALENVLVTLKAVMKNESDGVGSGKLICVFGCGGDRDRTKRPKMGAVAERLADRVIVTSDNPRTENPAAIIEEICAGFSSGWKEGGRISVETDRRAAIRMAIGMAEAGDVVLIAGKGHENYQIIGTTKQHFDDVEEAEAALAERLAASKKGATVRDVE